MAGPGTPPACAALAGSSPVKAVGRALAGLASEGSRAESVTTLRAAAVALRDVGSSAQGDLRSVLTEGAASLERLAASGGTDPVVLDAAGQALDRLGREVQAVCNFSFS